MVSLRSLLSLCLFTSLFSNTAEAAVTWKTRMVQRKVLPMMKRRLQTNTTEDVYVELCAPAIGDNEAALVIVGGLTDLTLYRGFVYISPNNNQWWDKTCGINGHGPCSETGQIGYTVTGEEGTGIFEPVEYAWNNGDENATYMAFCIVRTEVAPRMPEPAGGAFPTAFMASVNAVCTRVTRSVNGNSCLLDLPSSSPTPSQTPAAAMVTPVSEDESEGSSDAVNTPMVSVVPQSSTGAVPGSTISTTTDNTYNNSNVQGNSATTSTSTYALFATGVVATLVTLTLLNREH